MKRKLFLLLTVLIFGLGTLASNFPVFANSLSELEQEKKEISNKSSRVKSELEEKEKELDHIKSKQESIKDEVQNLDSEIQKLSSNIIKNNNEIDKKNKEISDLEKEIAELQKRIEKRDKLLMDRARAIQLTGGTISYLEVLLGANSFTDFISRVTALSTILESDKTILEEHKADHKEVKEKKKKVEKDKEKLESLKKQLKSQKAEVENKKEEKSQALDELKKEQATAEEYFMDLKEEQELLAAQESAVKKAIQMEKKRQEEAAKRAQEQQQQGNSENNQDGSNSDYDPSKQTGAFIRPTPGPVTSEFGWRWGKPHKGIDIGSTKRGVPGDPVYAAAPGVVTRSYYSSSYGNVVFITHYLDGQIYTTVYAHLNSRAVSTGAEVSQGQYIGAKGTTGDSTGVHLHFEIHRGEWNGSKSNAVNPRNYINF